MSIIQKRNIKFWNIVLEDGTIIKTAQGDKEGDMGFISDFTDIDTIDEIIDILEKALLGRFYLITDPDICTKAGDVAFVTPKGIEYWGFIAQDEKPSYCPLEDFYEMLIAWKEFLLTPPLHGSKFTDEKFRS